MKSKFLVVFLSLTASLFAQRSLHLAIGDPERKGKEVNLVLDAVTATATGELITPQQAVAGLSDIGIIFVGESHTSIDFHRVQLKIIEELHRSGKNVMIGLEMYPRSEQKWLDDWRQGLLTESGFLQLSRWYKNWGYHWNYYRDIFLFARDHNLRVFALNAPRDVVSAVTKRGLQNLAPEERAHIAPNVDTSSEEHFALFKAFFEDASEGMHSMMSDSQARAMFASQCTWDATMGYNAVRALQEYGDANTAMVVLIGSGHVAYGLGIQRQAAQWYKGKMASIIPIEVMDERGRPVKGVQASYADFVWGLPPEKDPLYPELGAATSEVPGETRRRVMSVGANTPAKIAGLQTGDILISMDGTPLPDGETLNRMVAAKSWGDSADLVVRRQSAQLGSQDFTLKVYFRRQAPPSKQP